MYGLKRLKSQPSSANEVKADLAYANETLDLYSGEILGSPATKTMCWRNKRIFATLRVKDQNDVYDFNATILWFFYPKQMKHYCQIQANEVI